MKAFVKDPFFNFVKETLGETSTYNCKVLDLSKIPLAKTGSEVTIFVRHTHREVSLKQLDEWINIYATLSSESRFCTKDGASNDIYTVKAVLNFLIPEFLPIQGKRARLYYHGIPTFCVRCYTIGHQNFECPNETVTWLDYIQKLKDDGIPESFFGTWEELNSSAARPPIDNVPQPSFNQANGSANNTRKKLPKTSTPARPIPEESNSELLQLVRQLVKNQSAEKPAARRGTPRGPRGRGRGRGQNRRQYEDGDEDDDDDEDDVEILEAPQRKNNRGRGSSRGFRGRQSGNRGRR